jgi:hypothetical protein
MADPFNIDSLAANNDPVAAFMRARQQKTQSPIQPFPAEEENSLLSNVANAGLSGLGYLGKTLDKTFGARAIRGLLGGKPRELLSPIPFSDTLGITDEEDITSGRDLLTRYHIAPPNDPNKWEAADVGGFLTELALDPSMYVNPFALTKLGGLAAKAGALPGKLLPRMKGFEYAGSQLGHLAEHAFGPGVAAADLAPRGASILPESLEQTARAAGLEARPQAMRTAPRIGSMTNLPPGMPAGLGMPEHILGPQPGMTEALDLLEKGGQPAFGKYARPIEPGVYETMQVGPGHTEGQIRQLGTRALPQPGTPLAGLVGLGLPGMDPFVTLGTGPTAQRIAGAIDRGVDWLKGTLPVRHLRALFDPRVDRAISAAGQELAAGVKRPLERQMMGETLGNVFDLRSAAEPLVRRQEPEVQRFLLRQAENVPNPATMEDFLTDLRTRDPLRYAQLESSGDLENLRGQFPAMRELGTRIGEAHAGTIDPERALGIATPELSDQLNYVMRRAMPIEGRRPGENFLQSLLRQGRSVFDVGHSSQMAREDILRGLPEGTSQINDLAKMRDPASGQPLLVGAERKMTDLQAEEFLRRQLTMTPGMPGTGVGDITEVEPEVRQQAKDLAKWFKGLDPRHALEQRDFFDPDIIANLGVRGAKSAKVRSSAEALYEGIARYARPAEELDTAGVGVNKVLQDAGLEKGPARELAAQRLGLRAPADLEKYAVPKDLARDMTKWLKAWSTPEELSPVLSAWDKAMTMFKGWVTAPFPGFHTRNITTGLFNMWRDDALSPQALADAKELLQGRATVAPLPGMAAGDAQQTAQNIIKEAVQNRVAFVRGTHQTSDAVRTALGDLPRMTAELPGQVVQSSEQLGSKLAGVVRPMDELAGLPGSKSLTEILGGLGQDTPKDLGAIADKLGVGADELRGLGVAGENLPDVLGKGSAESITDWLRGFKPETGQGVGAGIASMLDPTAIAGVRTGEDVNRIMRQMRNVGNVSEDWMRLAHYIAKRRQGFEPGAAADAVTKYHFDYGDLTPFERTVMRRTVPFYTYSSRNLPAILEDLATRPAKLAGTVRAGTSAAREGQEFVPSYLGEGVAVPVPGGPEGQQRFLSSFGLPMEDEAIKALASLLAGRGDRAVGNLLAGLNPALKYPIEVATDTQLHTGRRLSDLRPSNLASGFGLLGEDIANPLTQFLANTPAARVGTVIDKLADPRKGVLEKGMNLLSGARLTDVDMDRQREIAASNLIEEMLRGHKNIGHFERAYVRPENIPSLTPAELELLRLQKGLEKRASDRARAAKAPPSRPVNFGL